nr:MAG TPA: Repressor protein CI [Caudoviricetes sp.]
MEELKEFKDRLRKARIEKNLSQVDLGRLTGASQSKIAALESGRNKKPTNIIELSEILGVSAYWLETGKGDMHASIPPHQDEIKDIHRPMLWSSNDPLPEDDYTFAPYMKEQAFCGGAGSFEIPDYNGFRLPFGKATLRRKSISPDNVFCCTLTGDSMEERIAEDAAIAVDAGEKTIRDGKIYAFRHGDLFRVKYLSRLPGGRVKIKSHNPAYEDEEAGLEDIEVIGRVFWWSVLD